MSIQFNDTSTYKGLVQLYEKEIGATRADVSGDTNKLKELAADINLAMDDYTALAFRSSGTWQFDDSNQTDLPFITTNIVSGQRDYSLGLDGSGNQIFSIAKVAILTSATATRYDEISPVDVQSEPNVVGRFSDTTNTGVPYDYDKTGNSIIFGTVPNYNATAGLKVYISREPSYFTYLDTTKKAGVPGIHHRYLVLRAAEDYLRRTEDKRYVMVRNERLQMEKDIADFYGRRERDLRKQITSAPISFR